MSHVVESKTEVEQARAEVLEDVILGSDTNDVAVLRKRATDWAETNGIDFDIDSLDDDYGDDILGFVFDCIDTLSTEDVTEFLEEELDEEEIDKLVAEKMNY